MARVKNVRTSASPTGAAQVSPGTAAKLPKAKGIPAGAVRFTAVEATETGKSPAKGYLGAKYMMDVRRDIASKIESVSADLAMLGVCGRYLGSEFSGIEIAISGQTVSYRWGPWLSRVNGTPYRFYFSGQTQTDQTIGTGSSESQPGQTNTVLGHIRLHITGLRGSKRFGGSIEITLAPAEDFGIELGDRAENLYLDLHRWLLRVYLRPTSSMFNSPGSLQELSSATIAEIEGFQVDLYELQSGRFAPHPSATADDVNALLARAEKEMAPLLNKLARFALGFVHEQKLDGLIPGWRVDFVQVSDNFIEFKTTRKVAYVAVMMRVHYFGTARLEGFFDNDAEVTAEPLIGLWESTSGPVVLRAEKMQYIGSSTSTSLLTMGLCSLDDIARVKYFKVYPGWTESDPISDDKGCPPVLDAYTSFDRAVLQTMDDNNQLGKIGETHTMYGNDLLRDEISYAIEVEFHLVKI